ncbi:putative protein OS=Streptomyces fumanus OX=67302 GN=GCM10018772_02700 PE=4 SV=1 [Streptomyces fumanus]|uniref:Uncharacterized protein n=1 Tax=Streptomyces fumanus TaxID=67302 RepID=A0A919A3F6_9ACTN|nr:hypothetical protein GCM10018772_02700 [Streptomyces fumanus]
MAAKAEHVGPLAQVQVDESEEASTGPRKEFPAAAGVADLAYKLERALEWIEELEERVERLEGRDVD